ncbi:MULTISPECIES: hypothetical protein [unclassified Streptomyces]|uniref:hypothetical protein n=1 Tax=unclassified Streptomyces TaxID=2593676 RepID=UPI00093D2738|nr:hypothetical protein [Streptomyces sp. CB01883]OKJ74447.1 hypothetical protein AMK32_36360 [Streptomyces sp. CB01883]
MEQVVVESVSYVAVCQNCGARMECRGTQALACGRLRWDVESSCSACHDALAVCGGTVPAERREQMLAQHGPARLHVSGPSATGVAIMRVLRTELGIDLASAKALAHRVVNGDCTGTLSEMEYLARKLQESGITAVATRP